MLTNSSNGILPAATDDNLIVSHQAIAKESLFNKGQKDGKRDAKIFASTPSTATSNQKTNAPTSTTMTPDDIDCEAPDNLFGQDSIDYCKGYDQGFAKQNNLTAEK
jgi:hypothetical protein